MTPARDRAGRFVPPGRELQEWLPGYLDAQTEPLPALLGVSTFWVVERMGRHIRAANKLLDAGAIAAVDAEVDAYQRLRRQRDALRKCAVEVKGGAA